MKALLRISAALAFALGVAGLAAGTTEAQKEVWVATIRGSINPASSGYLQAAIEQAQAAKAEALIVELDTPGGLVSSVREMAQSISQSAVPVIVFVTPAGASATSAGALLMLSSHLAVMSPGTNIGAAHPVSGGGEEIKGAMGQKVLNDTVAFARGLADLRGRNRQLAEEIVAKSRSVTAEEAQKERLIEEIASNRAELLSRVHGRTVAVSAGPAKPDTTAPRMLATKGAAIRELPMSFGQKLLSYLADPNLAALLLTIGMMLIYIEASNPGLSIPGIAGAICLLVAFMALQMLPIRVGAAALVALGIALMLAEPFVTTHGIAATGGIVCFILGLLWLIDPAAGGGSLRVAPILIAGSTLTLGSIIAVIGFAVTRMRTQARKTLHEIGGGGVGGLQGYSGRVVEVSREGLAGRALFRGEIWEFESATPLSKGDEVRAVSLIEGMRVKVERP